MELREHLDVVGTLSIVLGALVAGFAVLGFFVASLVMGATPFQTGASERGLLGALFGFLVLVAFGMAALGIVGGLDLRARRPRGRILVMVLAVVSLFSFPIGTAFGAYALWALTRPGVEQALLPQTSTATP